MAGGIQQPGKEKKEIKAEKKTIDQTENMDDNISTSRFKNSKSNYLKLNVIDRKCNVFYILKL